MVVSFTIGWLLGSYLIGVAVAYTFICVANWGNRDIDALGGKGQLMLAGPVHAILWPLTLLINICVAIVEQRKELFKRDIRLIVCAIIGKDVGVLSDGYGLSDPDVERVNRRLRRLSSNKLYKLANAINRGYINDVILIRAIKMTIVERQVLGCDDYDEEL